MLGIPMARAFLAGAALLAGAHTRTALADGPDSADEVAFAVPRVRPADGGTVELPRPLGSTDVRRLRRVFALQDAGDIPAALAVSAEVTDPVVLGHVLAQRYLRPDWRGTPAELAAWLDDHAELPDAPAIWARYAAVAPKGTTLPPEPAATLPLALPPSPSVAGISRNPLLDRAVQIRVRAGQFDVAGRFLAHIKGLEPGYAGQLGAELAQSLFCANRDTEALETAAAAFRRGRGRPALAAWVAGLASWRLDDPERARTWFEAAWRAPDVDRSLRAGAAFWAARAEERSGADAAHDFWLSRAAREQGTFYGEIARRASGLRSGAAAASERMVLSEADVALVDSTPAGHRAFALLQVGQDGRAEAELRRLWGTARDTPGMGRAIALVAAQAGLGDFAAALQAVLADEQDPSAVPPLPLPRLRPAGGFRVDQALVYGVARVESNFDAAAVSPMGATGLMQLMPVTATYLAGNGKRVPPGLVAQMLRDPGGNLRLGQSYLLFLADALDGDLLRMLAAYNTGLGGFARWNGDVRHMDDPLLYIESIPVAETRAYVARALFFAWGYAARLGVPAPGLDDLAAGEWPRFTAAEPRTSLARLH